MERVVSDNRLDVCEGAVRKFGGGVHERVEVIEEEEGGGGVEEGLGKEDVIRAEEGDPI